MMQSGYEFEKGRIRAQEERKEKQIEEFVNFCEQQTISNKRKKNCVYLMLYRLCWN